MSNALREVLANLEIKVDLSELVAADTFLDATIKKLEHLLKLSGRTFKLPKIKEAPLKEGQPATDAPKPTSKPTAPVVAPAVATAFVDPMAAMMARRAQMRDIEGEAAARAIAQIGNVADAADPKVAKLVEQIKKAAYASGDLKAKQADLQIKVAAQTEAANKATAAAQAQAGADVKLNAEAEKQVAILGRLMTQQDGLAKRMGAATARVNGFQERIKGVAPAVKPTIDPLRQFWQNLWGNPASRAADGQLNSMKGLTGNIAEAVAQGEGLYGVLGHVRRIWGLLQFAAASAFGFAGFKVLTNEMDEAGKAAQVFGMTIEDYQTLDLFAKQAGASTSDLANVLKQLAKNTELAREGGKEQAAAFKELGVSIVGTNGESRELIELFFEAGGAIGQVENNTKKLAIAQKILGKQALAILPAFKDGTAAALDQLKVLRELAIVYSKDDADAAEAFNDTLDISVHQLKGVAFQLVNVMLPTMLRFVESLVKVTRALREMIKTSSTFQAILTMLVSGGIALLLARFATLMTATGAWQSALSRLGVIVGRFLAPFLVLDDIITWLRGGRSVLGSWIEYLGGAGASKMWIDRVWNVMKEIKDLLPELSAGWRVFKASIFGTKVDAGDVIKDAELQKKIDSIALRISEMLSKLGDGAKTAAKMLVTKFLAGSEEGVKVNQSTLGRIGSKIAEFILAGFAVRFAAGLALTITRIGVSAALTAAWSALASSGLGVLVSTLTTLAPTILGGWAATFGATLLAVLTAPVTWAIVALGALMLALFTEKGRNMLFDFGQLIVDYAIDFGRALGPWLVAFGKWAEELMIRAAKAFYDLVHILDLQLQSFSWDGLVEGFFKAMGKIWEGAKSIGKFIAGVFTNPAETLKLDNLSKEFEGFMANVKTINWHSQQGPVARALPEATLQGLRDAGAVIGGPRTDARQLTIQVGQADQKAIAEIEKAAGGFYETEPNYGDLEAAAGGT